VTGPRAKERAVLKTTPIPKLDLMNEQAVREVIRKAVEQLGGMRAASRAWGVSVAYVSDTLNGRRAPGPAILAPVGYERVVTVVYRKTK
jgi:hypothetical protein